MRDRLGVILAILDVCSSGATNIGVVYKANLIFKIANCYLKLPVKENSVEICIEVSALHRTTSKGYRIVDEFKNVYDELPKLNEISVE